MGCYVFSLLLWLLHPFSYVLPNKKEGTAVAVMIVAAIQEAGLSCPNTLPQPMNPHETENRKAQPEILYPTPWSRMANSCADP